MLLRFNPSLTAQVYQGHRGSPNLHPIPCIFVYFNAFQCCLCPLISCISFVVQCSVLAVEKDEANGPVETLDYTHHTFMAYGTMIINKCLVIISNGMVRPSGFHHTDVAA